MSVFLDTNVVVYAFDGADPDKQRIAIELLETGDRLIVSTQVLLETWWVLTRRLAVPVDEDHASAIEIARRFSIALWDALIIEAARAAGCRRVLSEDLQSGQDFAGVVVENPFES